MISHLLQIGHVFYYLIYYIWDEVTDKVHRSNEEALKLEEINGFISFETVAVFVHFLHARNASNIGITVMTFAC